MIFESELEKTAFDYMSSLASECTDRRGCNDLENEMREKFKGLTVPGEDTDGSIFQREINMDFDVCHWLILQIKEVEKNDG